MGLALNQALFANRKKFSAGDMLESMCITMGSMPLSLDGFELHAMIANAAKGTISFFIPKDKEKLCSYANQ